MNERLKEKIMFMVYGLDYTDKNGIMRCERKKNLFGSHHLTFCKSGNGIAAGSVCPVKKSVEFACFESCSFHDKNSPFL